MGKIVFEFLQDVSLLNNSNAHDLSILIGVDRFSFLISDPQQNVIGLKCYQYSQPLTPAYPVSTAIQEIYRIDELLAASYQSVRIGIHNATNTLVPDSLFQPEDLSIYFKNIIDHSPEDRLYHDSFKELNLHHLFALDSRVGSILENYYPNSRFFHGQSAALKGFSKLAAVQSGHQVFVNVHERSVQIAAFVGRDLLFNNSFPFESPNDFIYYLLLVYNQFQMKPDVVPLTISGLLVEDSRIYHMMYRYIRYLNIIQTPDYYRFPDTLKDQNLHFYFDLYCLRLCE